jgi:hypothetical protein
LRDAAAARFRKITVQEIAHRQGAERGNKETTPCFGTWRIEARAETLGYDDESDDGQTDQSANDQSQNEEDLLFARAKEHQPSRVWRWV